MYIYAYAIGYLLAALLFFNSSLELAGEEAAKSLLPDISKELSQDTLISISAQKFFSVDSKFPIGRRLFLLIGTRPLFDVKADGDTLFLKILVSREGFAIILRALHEKREILCSIQGPPVEIPANTYWYDKPLWIIHLQILARWRKDFAPFPIPKAFDRSEGVPWSQWITKRISNPGLKRASAKVRSPKDPVWNYEYVLGPNLTKEKRFKKATSQYHREAIRVNNENIKVMRASWWRRDRMLDGVVTEATKTLDLLICGDSSKPLLSRQFRSSQHFEDCRTAENELNYFITLQKEHRTKIRSDYRARIKTLEESIEFHKRGLAEIEEIDKGQVK